MGEVRVMLPDKVDRYIESLARTGMFSTKAELLRAALMEYLDRVSSIAREYDNRLIFSPEGRIYQLEYAMEASYRGAPVVGIVHRHGILFLAKIEEKRDNNGKVLKGVEHRKIFNIGKRYLITFSGLAADAYHIIHSVLARKFDNDEELIYYISKIYWRHTVAADLRPLGAATMLGSSQSQKIVCYDPSGAYTISKFAALGDGNGDIIAYLNSKYEEKMSREEALNLALESLGRPKDYLLSEILQ